MNLPELFGREHGEIRKLSSDCQAAAAGGKDPGAPLKRLQEAIQKHFRREDIYYRKLDDGKRIGDRALMHQMRNDHAAVLFTLESLTIRLRKQGANDDWRTRLKTMLDVLLPHLDKEENALFPAGEKILSAEERSAIIHDIEALG